MIGFKRQYAGGVETHNDKLIITHKVEGYHATDDKERTIEPGVYDILHFLNSRVEEWYCICNPETNDPLDEDDYFTVTTLALQHPRVQEK